MLCKRVWQLLALIRDPILSGSEYEPRTRHTRPHAAAAAPAYALRPRQYARDCSSPSTCYILVRFGIDSNTTCFKRPLQIRVGTNIQSRTAHRQTQRIRTAAFANFPEQEIPSEREMEGHDSWRWRRRGAACCCLCQRGRKQRRQDARLGQVARETIEKKPIDGRHIGCSEALLDDG